MNLFTTAEQKTAAEERQAKDVNRAIAIRDALETLLKQQAEAERTFDATLERQQAIWEEENEKRSLHKQELEAQIRDLEDRKARLTPIPADDDSTYTKEDELMAREEALMRRLDEVGERAQELDDRGAALLLAEQGLASQKRDFLVLMKRRT